MLKLEEIKEIVTLIDNSSINRFEYSQADTKLVLIKQDTETAGSPSVGVRDAIVAQTVRSASATEYNSGQTTAKEDEPPENNLLKITAPMVGTFYVAANPEAEPFVKIGQQVNDNSVVGVIEVMKLFNEVEAGVEGQIVEILVKDGEFVEYGQPLFLVKKV
jgi:acetyl-CoA carboxylase biotin carboxyl carrier protein